MMKYAKLLKYERERRSWSQEQLAEQLGTIRTNVSRWERGITFPSLYFRQRLCELFGKSLEELGLFNTIPETKLCPPEPQEVPVSLSLSSPLFWHLPHQRNPLFTGREEVLEYLHSALNTGETRVLTRIQAITGLGGIGKTQVAIEYAYRYATAYQIILWVRAETRSILLSEMITLAQTFGLIEKEEPKQSTAIGIIMNWLQQHHSWLLILDNVEEFSPLQELLPFQRSGHILLTTRCQFTGPLVQHINLEKMEPEEGAFFLLRRAKSIGSNYGLEHAPPTDSLIAREICQVLDGLPLALDQAGAYIEATKCSLPHYLDLFQHHRCVLLSLRDLSDDMHADHPCSVSATFLLCLERIKRANPMAFYVLQLCAFLHHDAIPEELFLAENLDQNLRHQDSVWDRLKLDMAIAQLHRHSLLHRNADTKTFSLHRLLQVVIKDSMDETVQRQWAWCAVRLVDRLFPRVQFWVTSNLCQRYLHQAQVCVTLIETWNISYREAGQLLTRLACYLFELAFYEQAASLLKKAIAILTNSVDASSSKVAETQQMLGWLDTALGKCTQTTRCYQQILVIREHLLELSLVYQRDCAEQVRGTIEY